MSKSKRECCSFSHVCFWINKHLSFPFLAYTDSYVALVRHTKLLDEIFSHVFLYLFLVEMDRIDKLLIKNLIFYRVGRKVNRKKIGREWVTRGKPWHAYWSSDIWRNATAGRGKACAYFGWNLHYSFLYPCSTPALAFFLIPSNIGTRLGGVYKLREVFREGRGSSQTSPYLTWSRQISRYFYSVTNFIAV